LILLFIGEEYLCYQKIQKLYDKYRETALNIHTNFDVKNTDMFFIAPILAKHNVFYLDYSDYKKIYKKSPQIFMSIPESTIIIMQAESVDKREKAYSDLKKFNVKIAVMPEFTEKGAVQWVADIAKKENIKIHPRAVSLLVHYIGANARALHSELLKLSKIATAGINETIVKLNTSVEREFKLYQLTDSLVKRKLRDVFIVNSFLKEQFDVFSIVRYLQNYFLNLIKVKVSKKLLSGNYQAYTIDKFREVANRYPLEELVEYEQFCLDAEIYIKFGMNSKIVLSDLLYKIIAERV